MFLISAMTMLSRVRVRIAAAPDPRQHLAIQIRSCPHAFQRHNQAADDGPHRRRQNNRKLQPTLH
jgi:hypothetical protein